jgi:L-lactate dehydrogenase complex protein LldG
LEKSDAMMAEREKILGRIREALKVSAPVPGKHGRGQLADLAKAHQNPSRWLPSGGDTFADQLELFRANAADLKGDFRLVETRDEMARHLFEIAEVEGWKKIALHRGELTDFACASLNLPSIETDGGYNVREMEKSDVGITECDALVAQTGSVLVSSRSAGGRALSVLPPHHVVLARREQLVPDLTTAIELLHKKYAHDFPSFFSFITGPSRTGDIERILVLGAHGPKKLTIICY